MVVSELISIEYFACLRDCDPNDVLVYLIWQHYFSKILIFWLVISGVAENVVVFISKRAQTFGSYRFSFPHRCLSNCLSKKNFTLYSITAHTPTLKSRNNQLFMSFLRSKMDRKSVFFLAYLNFRVIKCRKVINNEKVKANDYKWKIYRCQKPESFF